MGITRMNLPIHSLSSAAPIKICYSDAPHVSSPTYCKPVQCPLHLAFYRSSSPPIYSHSAGNLSQSTFSWQSDLCYTLSTPLNIQFAFMPLLHSFYPCHPTFSLLNLQQPSSNPTHPLDSMQPLSDLGSALFRLLLPPSPAPSYFSAFFLALCSPR